MNRPCPVCGGADRFAYIANPRSGGTPFWWCRQCRHVEGSGDTPLPPQVQRKLNADELRAAQLGYAAVAEWCAAQLWTPAGAAALEFLRRRGLSDATIANAKLGYHTDEYRGGVGPVIWHTNRDAYWGAKLGGLLGPQGEPRSLLRGSITIPYYHQGVCTLLRTRRLTGGYFSPAGVGLYAGGTPTLYNIDSIADVKLGDPVVLTEGEIKALASAQAGIPAVAQPGIGFLPTAYLNQLRRRKVVLGYDVEKRKDPFQLSPGESYTMRHIRNILGIDLQEQISKAAGLIKKLHAALRGAGDDDKAEISAQIELLNAQIRSLNSEIEARKQYGIALHVLRLPRPHDYDKIDIDAYLLTSTAEHYRELVKAAPKADEWYARRDGGGFDTKHGGIWIHGEQVANYQAIVAETMHIVDEIEAGSRHRLALITPSGQRREALISGEDWADDKSARKALRTALLEGTFDDDPRYVLKAIRMLSSKGDGPTERHIYAATGWEQIDGHWHYLAKDGAITANGINTKIRCEIDEGASGNHYALCGEGDAALGAATYLKWLKGYYCPQPLALMLAAHATLPLIHRFGRNSARPMVWLYHQSGALKTALTRAGCMALYGPKFTAERADGEPVAKWDGTSVGLSLQAYYYRDIPLLIDDYKPGVIAPEVFKRFLHNYSESTNRTKGTQFNTIAKQRPARTVIFSTAEDVPSTGDAGIDGRIIAMEMAREQINDERLAELQRIGAAGHLVAFWRTFIRDLAAALDHSVTGVEEQLQQMLKADDAALPGHRRTVGALRQNRMAWLLLSQWMVQAGHLSAAEKSVLDEAHLNARNLLAAQQSNRQNENRPGSIFIDVLRELIDSGELVIERAAMKCPRCQSDMHPHDQGWFCTGSATLSCQYHIPAARIIGFECEDGIGLYSNRAYTEVVEYRGRQRQPFLFTAQAIWQQIDADGLIVQRDKDRYQTTRRNPTRATSDGWGKPSKVLLVKKSAFFTEKSESHIFFMGSVGSAGSGVDLAHSNQESAWDRSGIGVGSEWDRWDRETGKSAHHAIPDPTDPTTIPRVGSGNIRSQSGQTGSDPADPMKKAYEPSKKESIVVADSKLPEFAAATAPPPVEILATLRLDQLVRLAELRNIPHPQRRTVASYIGHIQRCWKKPATA
jgi:hypothetical protein